MTDIVSPNRVGTRAQAKQSPQPTGVFRVPGTGPPPVKKQQVLGDLVKALAAKQAAERAEKIAERADKIAGDKAGTEKGKQPAGKGQPRKGKK